MIKILTAICLVCSTITAGVSKPIEVKRSFYEIKIYTFKSKEQQERIENFLKAAYLPALHKAGILKIGIFTPLETDTLNFGKKIFVFIPYKDLNQYVGLNKIIAGSKEFEDAGADYLKSSFDNSPYTRIESVLMQAFENSPQFESPVLTGDKKDRIYELRSYESATEKINQSKVKMFNVGDEISMFKRLGFNPMFYGEVLAGSHMPNLMYMTSFKSLASRDEHWKAFFDDPQWKKLVVMPEYLHTVSKVDIFLLHPTEYSDL